MAVEFTNTLNQRINFGTIASARLLQQKTFLNWVYLDNMGGDVLRLSPVGATDEEWGISIPAAPVALEDKLFFYADWSGAQGQWRSTNALTTGVHLLGITYDYGSTSNDPVMYVDGLSVAVTEVATPSGSYRTGTDNSLRISDTFSFDGILYSSLIYNRIMTATEILDAYNSRLFIPTYNGLVFAPNLNGAAGAIKDGDTLAAGNTIRDLISGADGVPNASPVFKNNTVLTLGGM